MCEWVDTEHLTEKMKLLAVEKQERKCQAVRNSCCAETVKALDTNRPATTQSYIEDTIRHLKFENMAY